MIRFALFHPQHGFLSKPPKDVDHRSIVTNWGARSSASPDLDALFPDEDTAQFCLEEIREDQNTFPVWVPKRTNRGTHVLVSIPLDEIQVKQITISLVWE